MPANVLQVFAPLSTQPSPVWVAFNFMDATSEPKSGSVMATAQRVSPEAIPGSQRDFCSGVPPSMIARARISGRVMREPAPPRDTRDSSSVTTIIPRVSSLPFGNRPPYCSGTERPKQPRSLRPCKMASGTISSSLCIRSASGATTSSANCWKVSAIMALSSASPRGPRSPPASTT